MRSFVRGFAPLTLALLLGGTTEAQVVRTAEQGCFSFPIELVPGPQRVLAQAPQYIAVADFNNDKFDDVVVSNSVSNEVTVVFGQDGTSFGSVVDLNVGRVLRGVQAGDLNSDGIPDIAVVDLLDGHAFVVTGNGDGTFNQPVSYKVGLRPIDIAIGNFDRQKGNDLVICDQLNHEVGVYLNEGLGRGFSSIGEFPAGASVKRCKAADLNGDGFDDIVVLNAGRDVGDISIRMNTGTGSFRVLTWNFIVGVDPADFAIADFNADGVPDLAVLNTGGTGVQNEFSVSILLNQTEVVNGTTRGTGLFTTLSPVRVSCPLTFGGIPIQCTPNFIAAADLDNDGFNDFAVTFSTKPTNTATMINTPGVVSAYKGHGDGTFDFSSQVSVGSDPQGVVAGDFNGDGITDLAIAEQGSLSVRILNALPPPLGECDKQCHVGHQCSSGFCVDGVCCNVASCPAGQFCNIPGTAGVCAPPAPNGNRCCSSADDQGGDGRCASGHCTDGVCCQDNRCPAGQSCAVAMHEGLCTVLSPGCIGDCDHGGTVTIDELLVMVNVAVDNAPTSRCEAGDSNGDGLITVDEILAAVHRALAGCSS